MPEENDSFKEGKVLFRKGQYQAALSKFNLILPLVKDKNNHLTVFNALTMLGECYYRLENFDEAMKNFDKARSLAESRQDRYSLAISQVNLAKVLGQYIRQGDSASSAQASYYLEEARQIFRQLNDDSGLERTNEVYAELESLQKKAEQKAIFASLSWPVNLTPNILLRSGSDFRSVIFETVRGESQLDAQQLDAIINMLQLIRDRLTLDDSPQNENH